MTKAKNGSIKRPSDRTPPKQLTPWKPGQSGNPAGRPKGSRNKLANEFIDAVYADFMAHGADAVRQVRQDDPSTYIRVIAGILPKETNVNINNSMSDAELDQRIQQLLLLTGIEGGVGGTANGASISESAAKPH